MLRNAGVCNQSALKVPHKLVGAGRCAVAQEPRRDEFCFRVDCNPRPNIAPTFGAFSVDVLGLAADKGPNLIALDSLAGQASHHPVHEPLASLAKLNQKPRYCALADAGAP